MFNRVKKINSNSTISEDGAPKKTPLSSPVFRNIILPIIGILVAVVVFTIAITIANDRPVIEESYFVTDDTKTSISLTPSHGESNANGLIQTHFVYTYDGDNVSSLKTYFEYPDEETAKSTLESIKDQPEFIGAVVEGKYIVVAADKNQYKGLTRADIQQQAEALKAFQEDQQQNQNSENDS